MSEYIKLEDAIKEAKAWSMYGNDDLVSRLGKLPSIDVIFCKDCKYYETTHLSPSALWTAMNVVDNYCNYWDCNVGIDDYCSYGERKDD